jgi:predicted transcriptional regulator
MLAERVMVTDPCTAHLDELIEEVLVRMRNASFRMLPVTDRAGIVVGVISTFSIMEHIVPNYIVSGDLNQIPYAPDIGVLRRHYDAYAGKKVSEVMEAKPLLVNRDESLLSVAAAMISFGKHEYALVIDRRKKLLGVISAGDILDQLQFIKQNEDNDA